MRGRHDLTVAATRPGAAVLDERGLVPPTASRASCRSRTARRITVRGLDIRGYRTTSMAKVPIGIYVTGHGARITLAHNHVHRMGNDNPTLGSFDINAHGIAVYGRSPSRPITRVRIRDNEVDHLHLGASESVVVNGNVTRWRITGNHIHDDNNIGIDAIGWEGTVPGRHRYATVDQARRGVIAGNTVSRIISRGNPSYWEGDGWCNCADGIYIDGAGHIDVRDNVVRTSDIGIEVGAENPRGHADAVRVRRNARQRQRVRRPRARRLQPEPRRGLRRAGHRQPLPRRQHPARRVTGAAAAVQAARDVDRRQHRGGHASRHPAPAPAQPPGRDARGRTPTSGWTTTATWLPCAPPERSSCGSVGSLTGFTTYVRRSGEDRHSHYRAQRPLTDDS